MPEILDEFEPVKAVKSQVKLKVGISGPSNSGKTDGALALATMFGSVEDPAKKPRILLIDTENRSASLYADRYDFDTIVLAAPYTPERYKRAMNRAVERGYDWLIVDSISHEWEGEGGILRRKDKTDLANPNANSFSNWGKIMPDHEAFVEFIKQIPIHCICTMRSKQAYVLEADGKGKMKPKKVGMAPIQRDGVEYEFTLVWDLDMGHNAVPSKDRTNLFAVDEVHDLRNPEIAKELRKWMSSGAAAAVVDEWKPNLGTVLPNGGTAQTAPSGQREPQRAQSPKLITPFQKQQFWTVARQAGKTDDDVKIYIWTRFKLNTTAEIPVENFAEACTWAKQPLTPRIVSPEEAKAREAAKALGVNEADLQHEWALAEGDWNAVYAKLCTVADAEATTPELEPALADPEPEPLVEAHPQTAKAARKASTTKKAG